MTHRMGARNPGLIDGTQGSVDAGILAAVHFTVSGTTPTIVNQKNVASVVRQAQGVYRITFSSALANTNYGMTGGGKHADSVDDQPLIIAANRNTGSSRGNYTTTEVDICCGIASASTVHDPEIVSIIIFDPAAASASYLAAASWTVSGTTITLQQQTNVSGVTRHSTGLYRVTFNSAVAAADYQAFGSNRQADFSNDVGGPIPGFSRSSTIPANTQSTTVADIMTGKFPGSSSTVFEPVRGSILFKDGASNPRGTIATVRFSVSGGVVTIDDQWNVASVSRISAGLFTVNFTTPISDAVYGMMGFGRFGDFGDGNTPVISMNRNSSAGRNIHTTTQCSVCIDDSNGSSTDPVSAGLWFVKPWLM